VHRWRRSRQVAGPVSVPVDRHSLPKAHTPAIKIAYYQECHFYTYSLNFIISQTKHFLEYF
jgi:hypothetical protein